MNREQFANWKDFSLRMAKTYPGASKRTREWLERMVHDGIDWILCNVSYKDVVDWDKTKGDESPSTRMRDWCWDNADCERENSKGGLTRAYMNWKERYGNRLCACIRAGLDMATRIGGGVVGFTVGDLKRMYPEGIPDWVSAHYTNEAGAPADLNTGKDEDSIWL